jgi:hypothetical protein
MLIIILTVITQGATVPSDLRGDLRGELFINSGFFQAVGVISFGKPSLPPLPRIQLPTTLAAQLTFVGNHSICLSPQFSPHLWLPSNAYP